jgi:hypothetical protein
MKGAEEPRVPQGQGAHQQRPQKAQNVGVAYFSWLLPLGLRRPNTDEWIAP